MTDVLIGECKDAQDALDEAKRKYNEALADNAQAQLDYLAAVSNRVNVTDAALWADYIAASNAYDRAVADEESAQMAYNNAVNATNVSENAYIAMTNAIATTNLSWTVEYTGGTKCEGKGAQALIDNLEATDIVPVSDGIKYGTDIWSTKDAAKTALNGYITAAGNTKTAYENRVTEVGTAKTNLDNATIAKNTADSNKTDAKNRYDNRFELQKQAEVEVAETKLAYDDTQAKLTAKATAVEAAEIAKKEACGCND